MNWKPALLPEWAAQGGSQGRLDPYFLVALASNFDDHRAPGEELQHLSVILELKQGHSTDAEAWLDNVVARDAGATFSRAAIRAKSRFITARIALTTVEILLSQEWIVQITLAQALVAQRVAPFGVRGTMQVPTTLGACPVSENRECNQDGERVLIAIIDHGCPFAHIALRAPGQDLATRVLAIWDQDEWPAFPTDHPAPIGHGYGRQVSRSALDTFMKASAQGNVVNEDACYRLARYSALDVPLTHGSHSLGLLAGNLSSILSEQGAESDFAQMADVVFVQLPRDVLQAPSSNALHRCILDGLRYIQDVAAVNEFDRIVVSVSYGAYVGPHDGSSLFERALDEMLDDPTLAVPMKTVFPTGNGYASSVHAIATLAPGTKANLDWLLPANNEVPTYAEIWRVETPDGIRNQMALSVQDASLALTPHGSWAWPDASAPSVIVVSQVQADGQWVALVRAAPTSRSDGSPAVAPHGRYRLNFTCDLPEAAVWNVYLDWGGENFGFPRRSFQSELRALPSETNVSINGAGTLIGSGCGYSKSIFLVGGYTELRAQGARMRSGYSAAGPSRGASRRTPDALACSDETYAMSGMPSTGTRSGTIDRMWGTSVAAPQAARQLANHRYLAVTGTDVQPSDAEQSRNECGSGFLDRAT